MPNPATAPAEARQPDPHRAVSARLDPAAAGKILRLLHTLVIYGKNVVQRLRQQRDPLDIPWYPFLTVIFGTTNPAEVTLIVIRGLLRAVALQARLHHLLPLPLREGAGGRGPGRDDPWLAEMTTSPQANQQTHPRQSRRRPAAPVIPAGWPAGDSSNDRLPTPEEDMFADIIAEDQDRPLGAILFDICRDLGIVPEQMDPATWAELRRAISLHGADPTPLVGRKSEAHSAAATNQLTIIFPPWPTLSPHSPTPACTGPP